MAETTQRLLTLLGLLQSRPVWTGPELADRLGVTTRSVRRDVQRLRDLGYPVHAAQGPAGGYRLGAGRALPPLLLDDEEAVAVAVSLRRTAASVTGAGDAAVRTLAKLEQVLPPRLRHTVRALLDATDSLPGPDTSIDADTLLTLARACRDRVRVRFDYADRRGTVSQRLAEPVRLVTAGDRWYLFAWDVDRADWRTFRVDRSTGVVATTWRFPFREHPDPVTHLQRAVSAAPYRHVARVVVDAPADEVRQRVSARSGTVTPIDDHRCELVAGGDDLTWVALYLASLPHRWRVVEPPELAAEAARLGRLLTEAADDVRP
jgi:predicted DNA-binding transcriptional regulator YafY